MKINLISRKDEQVTSVTKIMILLVRYLRRAMETKNTNTLFFTEGSNQLFHYLRGEDLKEFTIPQLNEAVLDLSKSFLLIDEAKFTTNIISLTAWFDDNCLIKECWITAEPKVLELFENNFLISNVLYNGASNWKSLTECLLKLNPVEKATGIFTAEKWVEIIFEIAEERQRKYQESLEKKLNDELKS